MQKVIKQIMVIIPFIFVLTTPFFFTQCAGYKINKETSGVYEGKCSKCGRFVTGGQKKCPYCGTEFTNAYRVSEEPIITTNNQKKLAKIAMTNEDKDACMAAVEKLTDQTALADVAKNANYRDLCKAAVDKITDQAVLADIAKNASAGYMRKIAVGKLTSQTLQAELAALEINRKQTVLASFLESSVMVFIPGGTFQMGSNSSEAYSSEKPVHTVTVSPFNIEKYEVTQGLWQAVIGSNPSQFQKGDNYPVENVSWEDCNEFIHKLNELTGKSYRLPTEAEWEYACRASTTSDRYGNIGAIAWYENNSGYSTHPVGQKRPNAFGLYDMLGNVSEWCYDWYDAEYYSVSLTNNPTGPASGAHRVDRGGSWSGPARLVRASDRVKDVADYRSLVLGFRLALDSANK